MDARARLEPALARDEDASEGSTPRARRSTHEASTRSGERDTGDVLLAAAGHSREPGAIERLGARPGGRAGRGRRRRARARAAPAALGVRPASPRLPQGEAAKCLDVCERLWGALSGDDGIRRRLGGGSTTDVAGFAAATYLRGLPWVAVPTTLDGPGRCRRSAGRRRRHRRGKNLAGAFHFPRAVVIDPTCSPRCRSAERRAGMAEVVKTGLLAGQEVWTLPESDDPRLRRLQGRDRSLRSLRDGGTAGMAESGAHICPRARGRLRLRGLTRRGRRARAACRAAALRAAPDSVEEILRPEPVGADLDAAWAALSVTRRARAVFVLLEAPGKPVVTTVPDADARAALEALIRR